MKVQVHVHKVVVMEVLPMEIRNSFAFSYRPLKSKQQHSKLGYKEVVQYELDIDEYVCNFNLLTSIRIGE